MRIPHLAAFLPETRSLVRVRAALPRTVDSIAGWGHKPSSDRARRLAARHRLPYLALEDGFIRSLGPAARGFAPLSVVVDAVGIHYDARQPSALELLLETAEADELPLAEALGALAKLRAERLTKINDAPELGPGELDTGRRPLVVVIDQVRGDASVELGLASERHFADMLDAALDENPGSAVLVKLHPEVAAGRRAGYLAERARRQGVAVLDREVNPLSLVEEAQRVYTVTSQTGMEALLCGTRVTCFGAPFYAGWGATDDRIPIPRRARRRTPLEIFAAAYLRYARYIDPLTGAACTLGRLLDRLAIIKRANERNRGHSVCLGFARWKRRLVRPFLAGTAASHHFVRSPERAVARSARSGGRVCVWASREPEALAARAAAAGVPVVRVEDGFLRSVGLGSDFLPGASLVFDRRGIYYDPGGLSELEEILEFEEFDPETLDQARRLRARLTETGVTKYNLGREAPFGFEVDPRRRLLVPGQVEDDASVRRGGGAITTNLDLLKAVRERNPDACIVYKPHPDVEAGNRRGGIEDRVARAYCDRILRGASPHAAIAAVDEVHTLTSLIGFEALLREREVVTYGGPFYAGWGLTRDLRHFPRRTRRLSLDQLVAGTLILYPAYVDPVSGLACDPETVIERLARGRRAAVRHGFRRARLIRRLGRIWRGLWAAAQPG
jgi:capsular polysaccharide export protein